MPDLSAERRGVNIWSGVTIPRVMRMRARATSAMPILTALFTMIPMITPMMRGAKREVRNVMDKSGGRRLTNAEVSNPEVEERFVRPERGVERTNYCEFLSSKM